MDNTDPLVSQDASFSARNSVTDLTRAVTGPKHEGSGHPPCPSPHCTGSREVISTVTGH